MRPAYRSGEAGKEARLRTRTTVHRARRAGGVFVSGPGERARRRGGGRMSGGPSASRVVQPPFPDPG